MLAQLQLNASTHPLDFAGSTSLLKLRAVFLGQAWIAVVAVKHI